jgi:hypothetical protein
MPVELGQRSVDPGHRAWAQRGRRFSRGRAPGLIDVGLVTIWCDVALELRVMNLGGLSLRDLEYVVAIADHGSFVRAAEHCRVA